MRRGFPKRTVNKNKLNNQKIVIDGIEFDSKKEGNRYCELKLLQRAGKISNLELQKSFELIPAQYETIETGEYYKVGAKKGQPKTKQVCVEQTVDYFADFVYKENGQTVVEDVKGYRDPSSAPYAKFVLKRKMMLYFHGIKIREV
jgi:hypothetical protein